MCLPTEMPKIPANTQMIGRIRIPGAFIKALGLKPGDNVAASSKIKIPNLSDKITVQNDYRVSFPRDVYKRRHSRN